MRIQLSDDAENAIRDLALHERRDARRQAEFMIEHELERRRLIKAPTPLVVIERDER